MKILKGVFVYSLIILAMLIIVGILLFAAMFVMPDFGVFGYKVINKSKKTVPEVSIALKDNTSIDYTKPVNIVIETGGHDVAIEYVTDSTTNILINKKDDMFGLYKDDKTYSDKVTTKIEGNTVNITAKSLEGVLTYRDSFIKVRLPKHKGKDLPLTYNIKVKTDSGNVIINGKSTTAGVENMKVHKLNVETVKGNLHVSGLREVVRSIIVDQKITGTENCLVLEELSLKTSGGTFDFKTFNAIACAKVTPLTEEIGEVEYIVGLNYVAIYDVNIESNKGDFKFKNLLGKLNISGPDILLEAGYVHTAGKGFYFNAQNGIFNIEKLSNQNLVNNSAPEKGITIITNNIDINIGEIYGESSIKSEYGNIIISKELTSPARIQSVHGDITIENALDTISVSSEYGNINVKKFSGKTYILNKQGSITATYNTEKFATAKAISLTTEIINTNGNITANNLMNQTKLTMHGKSNITANFNKMPVFTNNNIKHEISINGGNANISMPATEAFYLYNYSTGGSIGGKVGTTVIRNDINNTEVGNENKPQEIVSPITEVNKTKSTTIILKALSGNIYLSTKN